LFLTAIESNTKRYLKENIYLIVAIKVGLYHITIAKEKLL